MAVVAQPRSVRGRLVATYTLIAVLLAAAGMIVFAVLLHRGVTASLDTTLESRTAPVVAALAAPGPVRLPIIAGTLPPSSRAGETGSSVSSGDVTIDAFTAVYRPDGRVADLQPLGLPTAPLSKATVDAARFGVRRGTVSFGDERLRVMLIPVHRAGSTWVVAAGVNLSPATEGSNEAIHQLELAVPFLILLAALGAWILSGAALRPVEAMRVEADNLGERDPASRLTVPTTDELAKLATTFNALLDRLHRSLARQRDLIADAGHELRTPLAVLRTELDLADGPGRTRDDLVDSVAHAQREVERLSTLADDLLFLARADGPTPIVELQTVDLAAVVTEAARANRARAESLGLQIEVTASDPVLARADGLALRRAIDNLVANAFAATPPGGTVRLQALRSIAASVVSVVDTGNGFPEPFLDHAFERFSRPDPSRAAASGGAGLGLAIVAEIVKAHQGTVTVANNPHGGAAVTMTLRPTTGTADANIAQGLEHPSGRTPSAAKQPRIPTNGAGPDPARR